MKIRLLLLPLLAAGFALPAQNNLICKNFIPVTQVFAAAGYSMPSKTKERLGFNLQNLDQSSLTFTLGGKIFSKAFDFRYYQKTSSVTFINFSQMNNAQSFFQTFKAPAWSAMIDLSAFNPKNDFLKIKACAGSLSFSSSSSIIKSPAFYKYPSAFCSTLDSKNYLTVTQAQKSADPKPLSFAINAKTKPAVFDLAFTPDEYAHLNMCLPLQPGDFCKTTISANLNFFCLPEAGQTGYRMTSIPYSRQWNTAAGLQTLVAVPYFKSVTTLGMLTNPCGAVRFFGSTRLLAKYNNFSLEAGAFASDNLFVQNPMPFVTASKTASKTIVQAKVNPCLTFTKGKNSVIFGASALWDKSIKSADIVCNTTDTVNTRAGIKYYSPFNSLTVYLAADLSELESSCKRSYSLYAKYSHKFKDLSFNINSTCKWNSGCANSFKTGFTIYPGKTIMESFSASAEFEADNGKLTHYYNAALTLSRQWKFFKLSAKFSAAF